MMFKLLKDEIDGFKIKKLEDLSLEGLQDPELPFVIITEKPTMITFIVQNGPVKEVGVNGCQVDTIVDACISMLKSVDSRVQSRENTHAIINLQHALSWLKEGKRERIKRNVEGTDK